MSSQKQCMGCMEFYDAGLDVCPNCGYIDGQENPYVLHMKPGSLLRNRYIVGKSLGYGSFGVTYIGWDKLMRRKVAIKEYLPSEYATRLVETPELIISEKGSQKEKYEKGKEKFKNEAEKLGKVGKVEGVVYIYDTFEENQTAYIIMEYLEGMTLAKYLENKGTLSQEETMDLMIPVLQSMEKVHEEGIIHRDISPDNIFISTDSAGKLQVKLIDFGAARFATSSHSKSLTVLLRPGYSPEEQYRSSGDQGTYTDVYAIAAVMYQMITGTCPPDSLERRTAIERKKKDLLQNPSKFAPDITDNFEIAVMNALNVKIEDRTPTVSAFLEELISFEKVKRRGSSIKRIDFFTWPLWAKIAVPVSGVAAIAVVVGIVFWIAGITSAEENIVLPDGYTYVTNFVGKPLEDAIASAEDHRLLITQSDSRYSSRVDMGLVLEQDIDPFYVVLDNSNVGVVVSTGEEHYNLPDVIGYTEEEARKALECMDLEVITAISEKEYPGVANGTVVEQDIEPYTDVKTGDSIYITIADNNSTSSCKAPDLVGLILDDALKAAKAAGTSVTVTEKVFTDEKNHTEVISQNVEKGKDLESEESIEVTIALAVREFKMPALVYKDKEKALQLLKNIGINPTIKEISSELIMADLVAEQSTEKDTTVWPGEDVTVTISTGSAPFEMPDLVGKTEEEAKSILSENTLAVNIEYSYDENTDVGCVISQSIEAKREVTRGTEVTIVICSDENTEIVPDVVRKAQKEAEDTLTKKGFKVQIVEANSSDVEKGQVISQLPNAGSKQLQGTTIVLNVSKGAEQISVPDTVGMDQNSAVSLLESYGFNVSIGTEENKKSAGTVIRQDPSSGKRDKGATVTIIVSSGSASGGSGSQNSQEKPVVHNWSDWVTGLPGGVSSSGYEIEERTQYRSRKRSTTTGDSSTMSGWTLYDTKSQWGQYGGWSDWSTNAVGGSDSTDVQTKTQYQYCDRVYTESADPNLGGWEKYDTRHTGWGNWSGWQWDAVGGSDTRQVETQQVPTVYHMYRHLAGTNYHARTYYDHPMGGYYQTWIDYSAEEFNNSTPIAAGNYYYGGSSVEGYIAGPGTAYVGYGGIPNFILSIDYGTQYRYRDATYTHYYRRWGDWTGWQDAAVSATGDRQVNTRTAYRYRTRSLVYTYYFEKWGDWSGWSDSAASANSDTQVETRSLYRYKQR